MNNAQLQIGPDLAYRSYREASEGGHTSAETGWVYGLRAAIEWSQPETLYLQISLGYSEGKSRYEGSIQTLSQMTLSPFSSQTNHALFRSSLHLGYPLEWRNCLYTPVLGCGWKRWDRMASSYRGGYDELYTWGYLSGGVKTTFFLSQRSSCGLFIECMQTRLAEIQITQLFPWSVFLRLRNAWQGEMSAFLSYQRDFLEINLSPYYNYSPLGPSQKQKTPRGTFFEPASLAQEIGVQLRLTQTF